MKPPLYNEKDHIKYFEELKMNISPNCIVQNHYSESKIRYLIRTNDDTNFCYGYDEIKIKIPAPKAINTIEKVWNSIALTIDLATALIGDGILVPPVSAEYELIEITVIRLINSCGSRVLDIVSAEDKEKIILSMKRGRDECNRLHEEDTIGRQILNDFYKKSATTTSVEKLNSIINQFDNQYKYHREKIETEKKAKRDLRESKIKTNIAQYNATIKSNFFDLGLLCENKLTNTEKLREYSLLRKFCIKYMPQLSERNFKIESLYDNYPDYIPKESCAAFRENWIGLNKTYNILNRGIYGEEKVYEVLLLFDDRIRILKDYVWGCEHDFIAITPYGISTIEVKNLRGDYILTETGILKCLSSDKVGTKDVAFQSKKHIETLRRNLKDCPAFSANIPLQEIICSAEPNFTIKNNYHYIPVCYYNTIDKILLPNEGKIVLSNEAMDEIYKYLLDNQRETFKYDVFLPHGEINSRSGFISSFAEVASGYIVAQNIKE